MSAIDVKKVKELLAYDPSIGGSCLVWIKSVPGSKGKGFMAGCKGSSGYWKIGLFGKDYQAHRIVFALVTNQDPQTHIDHINGIRDDNRIENLRITTNNHLDNQQNLKKYKTNVSGYTGVSWNKHAKKWSAYINYKRKKNHLGYFDTEQQAYAAYLQMKQELHTFQPAPR